MFDSEDRDQIDLENQEESAEEEETASSLSELTSDEESESQEFQWYVVNTYTGRERAVRDSLEMRSNKLNFSNMIHRIIVAEYEEPVLDKATGKPNGKMKTKNYYPGYVFIEMKMSDEAWYMVRNTPDVTGFVGSSGKGTKPFPIPKSEIEPILKKLKIPGDDIFTDYKVGDNIKILAGTFEDTEGTILAVHPETQTVDVSITFFGRPAPITVSFSEIEKL